MIYLKYSLICHSGNMIYLKYSLICHSGFMSLRINTGISHPNAFEYYLLRFLHPLEDSLAGMTNRKHKKVYMIYHIIIYDYNNSCFFSENNSLVLQYYLVIVYIYSLYIEKNYENWLRIYFKWLGRA